MVWRIGSRKRNLKNIMRYFERLEVIQRSTANDWSEQEVDAMISACQEIKRLGLLYRTTPQ